MKMNFNGLGIELGQVRRGLVSSPEKAKEYFSILNNAGLEIHDRGTIIQPERFSRIRIFNESDLKKMNWNVYEDSYQRTFDLLAEPFPLLNWGGDHSIALSTVSAFADSYPDGYVVWIDAHADLNLPNYSLTGNLHGMPMSVLLNLQNIASHHFKWMKTPLRPERIIYIGLRDLDPFENETIEKLQIKAFTRRRVRKWGIGNILNEVIHTIGNSPVHLSFDIDSVDPRIAPSTGVPVSDGLTEEELNALAVRFQAALNIKSIDMVELNPHLGTGLQVDQTFITAMHFLKTLFASPGGFDESMGKRNQTEHSSQMEWSF